MSLTTCWRDLPSLFLGKSCGIVRRIYQMWRTPHRSPHSEKQTLEYCTLKATGKTGIVNRYRIIPEERLSADFNWHFIDGFCKISAQFFLHIQFSISISTSLHHLSSVAICFVFIRIRIFHCVNVLHRSGENGKLDLLLLIFIKIEVGWFLCFILFLILYVRDESFVSVCRRSWDVNKNSSLITRISLLFGSFDKKSNWDYITMIIRRIIMVTYRRTSNLIFNSF